MRLARRRVERRSAGHGPGSTMTGVPTLERLVLRTLVQFITGAMSATAMIACGAGQSPSTPTPISSDSPGGSGGGSSVRVVAMVDVTTGLDVTQGGTGTFNWIGQSLVVPGGGKVDHVRFNWYTFKREPTAFGRLYILAQEFAGIPGPRAVDAGARRRVGADRRRRVRVLLVAFARWRNEVLVLHRHAGLMCRELRRRHLPRRGRVRDGLADTGLSKGAGERPHGQWCLCPTASWRIRRR
jgi:hypothetical protein